MKLIFPWQLRLWDWRNHKSQKPLAFHVLGMNCLQRLDEVSIFIFLDTQEVRLLHL